MGVRILLALLLSLPVIAGVVEKMNRCSTISSSSRRLSCYDKLTASQHRTKTASNNGKWIVSDKQDAMDGNRNVTATLLGQPLPTKWGEKRPALILRCLKGKVDVFVSWPWYMGNDKQKGRIRFDDGDPSWAKWMPSTTGTATFYMGDKIDLINEMGTHRKMVVEGKPYSRVREYATFDITGAEKIGDKVKAGCKWQ